MGQKERETQVVCVANRKGGVGKSTTTLSISTTMALDFGRKVLVVDCDVQGSITKFGILKDPPETAPFAIDVVANPLLENRTEKDVIDWLKSLEKILENALGKYDYIFIDVPGYIDDNLITVFAYTDAVIIPVVMSEMDVVATQDFIEKIVAKVRMLKEAEGQKFFVRMVLNKITNRKNNRFIHQFSEAVNIPVIKNGMRLRDKHYDQDLSLKTGITQGDKSHEIYLITEEIISELEK